MDREIGRLFVLSSKLNFARAKLIVVVEENPVVARSLKSLLRYRGTVRLVASNELLNSKVRTEFTNIDSLLIIDLSSVKTPLGIYLKTLRSYYVGSENCGTPNSGNSGTSGDSRKS
jgi:hypothetical protein